jgi:acyl-CoA oxidase
MAVVFAQLYVNGTNHGVHVFAIEIRDYDTHEPKPGCTIGNLGEKVGLNGIDNGFIHFDNYRVPYDCLLDRFSHLSADGKFKSTIKNKDKRFGLMLAGLHRGRMGVLIQSQTNLQNSLTIALRYAAIRKQFGTDGEERRILDYPLHRHRLMPHLANCIAMGTLADWTMLSYRETRPLIFSDPEHVQVNELHIIISLFKPLCTAWASVGLQECREACGGHGYLAKARLG